jgi:hypothetical protein
LRLASPGDGFEAARRAKILEASLPAALAFGPMIRAEGAGADHRSGGMAVRG